MELPVKIPSGTDFRHPVLAIGVIGFSPFSILKCTTSNGIDTNEKDKHDNVEYRELMPVYFHSFKNSGFARITVVAQQVLCVVPPVAIRVLTQHCATIIAWCWWLATTGLHAQQQDHKPFTINTYISRLINTKLNS